jgi:hypothetical protein
MSMIIFFGGLALGFLLGWVFLALLTMASINRQKDRLYDDRLYNEDLVPKTGQLHPQGPQ